MWYIYEDVPILIVLFIVFHIIPAAQTSFKKLVIFLSAARRLGGRASSQFDFLCFPFFASLLLRAIR